jgi:hypothetical protein
MKKLKGAIMNKNFCWNCGEDLNKNSHEENSCVEIDCSCYEIIGGHQQGCFFYNNPVHPDEKNSYAKNAYWYYGILDHIIPLLPDNSLNLTTLKKERDRLWELAHGKK